MANLEPPRQTQVAVAVRSVLAAQARRRQLDAWQRHYNALLMARTHNSEERLAQVQALELMKQARP